MQIRLLAMTLAQFGLIVLCQAELDVVRYQLLFSTPGPALIASRNFTVF